MAEARTIKDIAFDAYGRLFDVYSIGALADRIFPGDGWDVCCATWFGYTTFWVNRADAPLERLGARPTVEGQSLNDVVEFAR